MTANSVGTSGFGMQDDFLARLAAGKFITQDEYDQTAQFLPDEDLAAALAKRFELTGEVKLLVEAANLFSRASAPYQALEVCSRAPNTPGLQKIITRILAEVRLEYPSTAMVGKLTEEALLVIDLQRGKIIRFPPILPSSGDSQAE